MSFLYGASVKKIQSYIFESSRLREIAGASELVEYICTDLFSQNFMKGDNVKTIIQAAGNIRAVIEDRETAAEIMLRFPKMATEAAPGIQLVQGIVELQGDQLTAKDSQALEEILKQQTPIQSAYKDWSVTRKSARSGKPLFKEENGVAYDLGNWKKKEAVNAHWRKLENKFDVERPFPCDIERIAGKDNFVAVIHADGNSLGKTLMALKDAPDYAEKWRKFSQELDRATISAARRSYEEIFNQQEKKFRAIILGGDDLTVVCAAEYAIDFTRKYLEYFKEECANRPELGQLTACAGIAFIKANYPFYYGIELAEMLCAATKKAAKACSEDPVPSSFMFAKELGSFVDDSYAAFVARNLTIQRTNGNDLSLVFGPYKTFEHEPGGKPLPFIGDLQNCVDCLNDYKPFHSAIRKLMTESHLSEDAVKILADRAEAIAISKGKKKNLDSLKSNLAALTGKEDGSLFEYFCKGDKSPMMDLLVAEQFTVEKKGAK